LFYNKVVNSWVLFTDCSLSFFARRNFFFTPRKFSQNVKFFKKSNCP